MMEQVRQIDLEFSESFGIEVVPDSYIISSELAMGLMAEESFPDQKAKELSVSGASLVEVLDDFYDRFVAKIKPEQISPFYVKEELPERTSEQLSKIDIIEYFISKAIGPKGVDKIFLELKDSFKPGAIMLPIDSFFSATEPVLLVAHEEHHRVYQAASMAEKLSMVLGFQTVMRALQDIQFDKLECTAYEFLKQIDDRLVVSAEEFWIQLVQEEEARYEEGDPMQLPGKILKRIVLDATEKGLLGVAYERGLETASRQAQMAEFAASDFMTELNSLLLYLPVDTLTSK